MAADGRSYKVPRGSNMARAVEHGEYVNVEPFAVGAMRRSPRPAHRSLAPQRAPDVPGWPLLRHDGFHQGRGRAAIRRPPLALLASLRERPFASAPDLAMRVADVLQEERWWERLDSLAGSANCARIDRPTRSMPRGAAAAEECSHRGATFGAA